jgi:hypothetical protein
MVHIPKWEFRDVTVHVPHKSWSSLIARYPLYRWAPLHTSEVCDRHHYKVVQWFPLACSVSAEVSPEVSIQITKGPLLRCVVLRRVHYFTHSFPTTWIPRESTQSIPPIGMPNYVIPHTTPGRTHIGSWLYCFYLWSLHELVLRFGHDD